MGISIQYILYTFVENFLFKSRSWNLVRLSEITACFTEKLHLGRKQRSISFVMVNSHPVPVKESLLKFP